MGLNQRFLKNSAKPMSSNLKNKTQGNEPLCFFVPDSIISNCGLVWIPCPSVLPATLKTSFLSIGEVEAVW